MEKAFFCGFKKMVRRATKHSPNTRVSSWKCQILQYVIGSSSTTTERPCPFWAIALQLSTARHHLWNPSVPTFVRVPNFEIITVWQGMFSPEYHIENKSWDKLRVEFSISKVKTKTLRSDLKPKTWNHHCFTYSQSSGEVRLFSGGRIQSRAVLKKKSKPRDKVTAGTTRSHPVFPPRGMLILGQEQEEICGGFDDYDSLSGDLSELHVS